MISTNGEKTILWRISSPYFVAGLIVENDRVVESAPILKWSIGRQWTWMRGYCVKKGWHGQRLNQSKQGSPATENPA